MKLSNIKAHRSSPAYYLCRSIYCAFMNSLKKKRKALISGTHIFGAYKQGGSVVSPSPSKLVLSRAGD